MIHLQLTLFLLLAVGYFCSLKNIITKEGKRVLTALCIDIFLPASIIRSFMISMDADTIKKMGLALIITLIYEIFCILFGRFLYPGVDERKKQCLEYGTICSNAGFMGQPMAEGVFGTEGILYSSMVVSVMRLFMWSAGVALFTPAKGKEVVRKVLTHPCIVAVYIGLFFMITGINVPVFLSDALKYSANAVTATSMIVIGCVLQQTDLKSMQGKGWMIYYTILRLIVIPGIVYVILTVAGTDIMLRNVTVMMLAMPAGSTTAMLAASYGGDEEFASGIVFLSTLCSIITLPLWSLLF